MMLALLLALQVAKPCPAASQSHFPHVVANSIAQARDSVWGYYVVLDTIRWRTGRCTFPANTTPPVSPPVAPPLPPPSPPTPPAAGTVLLDERFAYASQSAYVNSSLYSRGEDADFASIGVIDSLGVRFDMPVRTSNLCGDISYGRNLTLPTQEADIWVEVTARFQSGFSTKAPPAWNCTSAPAYKFLFGRTPVSRFQLVLGIFGGSYTLGYPNNEEPGDWPMTFPAFDGRDHVYTLHMRVGPQGTLAFWFDGQLIRDFGIVNVPPGLIYGLGLGRNMNQGTDHPESWWIRRVVVRR